MENASLSQKNKRYYELDWLKTICILGMVMIHCLETWAIGHTFSPSDLELLTSDVGSSILLVLGNVAPAFMMCLGCGIVLSKRSSFEYLFKRGVIILIIGIILNIFRGFIPALIVGGVSGEFLPIDVLIGSILQNDIFIFAGLAFIFFAFVKKFNWNNWVLLFTGVILLIVNIVIPNDLFGDNLVLSTLFGWLFQQESVMCYFSFSCIIIYPIVGYIVGQHLTKAENRKSFYKTMFLASLIGLIALSITIIYLGGNPVFLISSDFYYHPKFITTAWFICEAGVVVPILYCIAEALKKKKITHFVSDISRKILNIYVAQWILICWIHTIMILIGVNLVSIQISVVSSIGVFIASYFLASMYLKLKKAYKNRKASIQTT